MSRSDYPISRNDGLLTQSVGDEVLVYDLNADKALSLNPTTAAVWRLCDGTRSVTDVSRLVSATLGSEVSAQVVWMAINQLKTMNLLADGDELTTPFDGMSRREMVKRIGLASAAALPVIFEVVAPTALHAQSVNCSPFPNCNVGVIGTCVCTPIVQPGSNNNVDGCRCATNGDCIGNCSCGAPCTAGTCGPGEICQSGICFLGQVSTGVPCNGSCQAGTTCNPDGSCAGVCPASPFNFCTGGGTTNPFCIPNNGGNLSAACCPCSIDGDCIGSCSNNNTGPPGVCI